MAISDILRVAVMTNTDRQLGVNVLHYQVTAESTPAPTHLQIANALFTQYAAPYEALMTEEAAFTAVGVSKIFPLPATPQIISDLPAGIGDVAGEPLPSQVSGIITWRTDFAGRANRGRSYIAFPAEADSGAFAPTPGYVMRLQTLATAMMGPIVITAGANSITIKLVILHGPPAAAGSVTFVTSGHGRTYWVTQRKRDHYHRG